MSFQLYMQDPHYRAMSDWTWNVKPGINKKLGDHSNPDPGVHSPLFLSSTDDFAVQMSKSPTQYYDTSINPTTYYFTPKQAEKLEQISDKLNDPYGVMYTAIGEDEAAQSMAIQYEPYYVPNLYGQPSLRARRHGSGYEPL